MLKTQTTNSVQNTSFLFIERTFSTEKNSFFKFSKMEVVVVVGEVEVVGFDLISVRKKR